MINKSVLDLMEMSLKRADETLAAAAASPVVRHLRLAGVELLRAARCGLEGAIDVLEPRRQDKETPAETEQ
jgi:hypothetical protein